MLLPPLSPEEARSHAVLSQQALALDTHLQHHHDLFLRDSLPFDHLAMFLAAKQFLPRPLQRPLPSLRQAVLSLEQNFSVQHLDRNSVCVGKLEEQCREDLVALLEKE